MNPWLAVSLFVGELIVIVVLLLAFHERGYRRGRKRGFHEGVEIGYTRGHQDADNWWFGAEQQVDRERQKTWKEGTER